MEKTFILYFGKISMLAVRIWNEKWVSI